MFKKRDEKIEKTRVKSKLSKLSAKLESSKFRISFGIFIVLFSAYLHQSFKISRHDSIDTNGLYSYWLHGNRTELEYKSLEKVLNEMGLSSIVMTFRENEDIHMDWHLSWTSGLQADLPINFDKTKPHQKFNHFPGNDVLTTKRLLAAKLKSKYVPRAFDNVGDLKLFAASNPNQKFFFKNQEETSIKSIVDLDLENSERRFVQKYIKNPLLIDGHKFDLGLFVAITSIDPLRLYYYPDHILLQFCALPYRSSNSSEVQRFDCSSAGISGADFPEVKNRLTNTKTVKRAFESHLHERGINFRTIWSSVEDSIRNVVMETENFFIKEVKT